MWKAVSYEVRGRGHEKVSMPCQDKTLIYKLNDVHIIALADGAGSAKYSHFGAESVLNAAGEFIVNHFDELITNEDGKQVKMDLLSTMLEKLEEKSAELSCERKELASTFLMVAVKEDKYIICHIGDGVVGYLKGNELKIASKPENGEYANTTTFVTSKEALAIMKLFKGSLGDINGFVLMSDGTAESFYNKREVTLAPVLVKLMHRNAILDHNRMFESIKQSFDQVVVNNTQDDCSIAILSRQSKELYSYSDMNNVEKCEYLGIKYCFPRVKRELESYDRIIDFLETSKNIEQVSRHLHTKQKYARRKLSRLLEVGLIKKNNHRFQRAV